MHESLDILRTSAALARHAGQRQATAAINAANADTPGYRAQALPAFAEAMAAAGPRVTRAGHLTEVGAARAFDTPGEAAPNGNTVSLEAEMFASVQASREHNQALAVWRHALTVLRSSLGR
jgi:flagellar basal-body rod protein FlgB